MFKKKHENESPTLQGCVTQPVRITLLTVSLNTDILEIIDKY
jgi:hypothetical protein